ncbi:MAG: penicillin acylase family protein [Pirellulaceae bacterium]|jgi:penicillin amidase|nr:penicillin acylase family protein [Pirellulaceae bacterium]
MKPLKIPRADRQVQVVRDGHGIPHVQADHWLDAVYGLGYMHATDRGTQLLFARSIARGSAAGDISNSPELLETDCFFRRVGLHMHLQREIELLEDDVREQLEAYSDGVNDGLLKLGRSLPMWATGFRPRSWTVQSSLLIGNLLSFGGLAVSRLQNERLLMELIHAGVSDVALREMFAPRLDHVDFDLLRQVRISNRFSDEALELLADLPRLAGSNAWAVAPQRSASGQALLASDPHLEINRLPAIWYEAALRWGDHYVMGATLPGCPLFSVARTDRVAWGVTYMKGDTTDFFVEDCQLGGANGWQYRRDEQWHDFQLRREVIQRKGADPETLLVLENEQGTLEMDLGQLRPGYHLSCCWTGRQPGYGKSLESWLNMIHSSSVAEAMDVARECPQPTLCWVLADVEGHIGLQGCGRFPKRGNQQIGLAPIPAWDSANHWQGILDTTILPSYYDPPEGFVATANEEFNPVDGPLLMAHPLPDYRKRRIDERLAQLPQATLEDMQELQYDVVSLQARELLDIFLPHLPDGEIKNQLQQWDCRYTPDSQEASWFLKLYRGVIMEMIGNEHGIGWRRMLYLSSRAGYSTMILTAADRLLMREKSSWWQGKSKADLVRRAYEHVQAESPQPWSEINSFHFTDRFFGNQRAGRLLGFKSRRYAMPGNHATPFQGHVMQTATRETTFAPSYHLVTDMGSDAAWTNLPGGPSESRFSRYYRNDLPNWFTGTYKQLQPGIESTSQDD